MKLKYSNYFKTESHINSIKLNSKDYIFYTQSNTIHLINPTLTTANNNTPPPPLIYTGHNNPVNSIDIFQDQLVSCSSNVQIHNLLENASPIRKYFTDDPFQINQVIFINESLIATGDDNKQCKVYDLKQTSSHKPCQVFDDPKDSINSVAYDGFKISCGSNDGMLYTYDLRMGLLYIDEFKTPITAVKLDREGSEVLINCLHQDMIRFNLGKKEKIASYVIGLDGKINSGEYKVDNAIVKLPHDSQRRCYLSGSSDGDGVLYGFDDENQSHSIRMRGGVLSSIDSDDQGHLVVGSDFGVELISVDL